MLQNYESDFFYVIFLMNCWLCYVPNQGLKQLDKAAESTGVQLEPITNFQQVF